MQVNVFIFTIKIMETPNFDKINPSLCINAKLRRLHRLINTAYQSKINPFGLRGSMLSILFIIGKVKEVNQKMIADRLVLDQSTMSRDLKKLIEKGWVRRFKGQDARHSILELTDEGYALLEEVSPVWQSLHNNITNILGLYNIQQIDKLTSAIVENLEFIKE